MQDLRTATSLHGRNVHRVFVLAVIIVAVLVVGMLLTLALARPSLDVLVATAAEGTRLATWQLLAASSWALIPVALMLFAGLAYIGMILRYADSAHTGRAVFDRSAWRLTVWRLPRAAVVLLTVGVAFICTVALAPAISVVALLALAVTPLVRRQWPSATWPSVRRLAWLAVPLVAAAIVAVRGAMALPEVFLAGQRPRSALRAGWQRSGSQLRRVGPVLVAAAVGAMAGMWALVAISMPVGNPIFAALLEMSGTVLFAPLPIVALLVMYRATGGTSTSLATSTPGGPGPIMPSLLAFALLATVIVPSSAPAFADALVATEVTITSPFPTSVDPASWEFGDDTVTVEGTVTSAHSDDPVGDLTLLAQRKGSDDQTEVAALKLDPADDGFFTFTGMVLLAGDWELQVTYSADDDIHADSATVTDAVNVTVTPRDLHGQITTDPEPGTDPEDQITVGDTIDVIFTMDDTRFGGEPVMVDGTPLEEVDFLHGTADDLDELIGTAELIHDEDNDVFWASVSHQITERITYFAVRVPDDQPNYQLISVVDNITQDYVKPADSSVEMIAPTEVAYGEKVTVVVRVTGPDGVPAEGNIRFEDDSGGDFSTFSTGHTLTYNPSGDYSEVEVTFCASVDEDCVPGGTPRLAFADEEAEPLTIRAEYRPAGLNDLRNALNGSTSASHVMSLDTFGLGACKPLELSMTLLDGLGHENRDVDDFADARIRTGANCEDGGYLGGTAVTLEARPAYGFELVEWLFEGSQISTDENFVFRLPDDDEEWERRRLSARYRPVCYTTDVEIVGAGRVVSPPRAMGNPFGRSLDGHGGCELENGTRGALYLSEMFLEVGADNNPDTGEPDVFRSIGSMPIDYEHTSRQRNIALGGGTIEEVRFTIDRDVVVPFEFGPVCRSVLTPSNEFGGSQLLTAPNCDSPDGAGYLRNSSVTASARIDDDSAVLAGWLLDGQPLADAGASPQVTFPVGDAPTTTIEPEFSWCHDAEVRLASTYPHQGAVRVDVSPEPNCFDGTERWLHGTELTLNPLGGGGFGFGGWIDADGAEGPQVRGSVNDDGVRRVVLEEPLDTTAHFIVPQVCSEIVMVGRAGGTLLGLDDVRFPNSGCGPGRYLDAAKRDIYFSNVPIERRDYEGLTPGPRSFDYTSLVMEIHNDRLLAATGSVFMRQSFFRGPDWTSGRVQFECMPPRVEQASDGSWVKTGITRCYMMVRGDLQIRLEQCQGLEPTVNITLAGDDSNRIFSPRDFPVDGHAWVTGSVSNRMPCGTGFDANPQFWVPDSEVTLRAQSPAIGFEFLDWGHVDFDTGVELFIGEDPSQGRAPLGVNVLTNDERPTVRATVNYQAHCATLHLGNNVRLEEPRPNCPGAPPGELSYLIGTFVQVSADSTRGGRNFERFRGVVANTTGIDDNNRPTAVTLINDSNSVSAVYPTETDKFISALGTVGKFTLAIGSLAAAASVTVACPPCGVALTALTASAFLLDLVPGMGGWATAVLDMVNPLSVLECAAKWGFGTTGSADSGGSAAGGASATASTTIKSIRFAYEASTEGSERAVGTITARSSTASAAAGAQFAYGLYEHRIDQIDLNYQSVEQLRDTATWNSCMNDKYRAAT